MSNTTKIKTPNEGEQYLDLPMEELMEVGINPPPTTNPEPVVTAEREETISPLPEPMGRDEVSEEASEIFTSLSLKNKRLSGSKRKRLSRLLKSGVPYETALRTILEAEPVQPPERGQQTSSGRIEKGKRPRSDGSSPEMRAKKAREGEPIKPSFGAVAGGIRVGIIHTEYPGTALTNDQLGALQRAIMKSVEQIPEEGPQVRFLGCTYRPGWLLITCADRESVLWLESVSDRLQPWEGARLKVVQGEDIPKPHVYVAYIPDDAGYRLTSEEVFLRLRKMNRGLNTREWKVLHREQSKPGQTWTFSVDETSKTALEGLNNRPFFGFGQIQFRPKNKLGERRISPPERKLGAIPAAKEGGSSPPPKTGVKRPQENKTGRFLPGKSGKGKSPPNKPEASGKGKHPPNKPPPKKGGAVGRGGKSLRGARGRGGKSLPPKSFFMKRSGAEPSKNEEGTISLVGEPAPPSHPSSSSST